MLLVFSAKLCALANLYVGVALFPEKRPSPTQLRKG
jgi:hypothetical protein